MRGLLKNKGSLATELSSTRSNHPAPPVVWEYELRELHCVAGKSTGRIYTSRKGFLDIARPGKRQSISDRSVDYSPTQVSRRVRPGRLDVLAESSSGATSEWNRGSAEKQSIYSSKEGRVAWDNGRGEINGKHQGEGDMSHLHSDYFYRLPTLVCESLNTDLDNLSI